MSLSVLSQEIIDVLALNAEWGIFQILRPIQVKQFYYIEWIRSFFCHFIHGTVLDQ